MTHLSAAGKAFLFAIMIRPAETFIDQDSMSFAKNYTQHWVRETHEEYALHGSPALSLLSTEDTADECEKCVGSVAKFIMDKVVKGLDAKCAKPSKCSKQKRFCMLYKKHPKIVIGMMWFWVRPVGDGYLYCMGKGSCKPKQIDLENIQDVMKLGMDAAHLLDFAVKELEFNESFKFDVEEAKKMEIQVRRQDQDYEEELEESLATPDYGDFGLQEAFGGPKPPRACVEKVIKHIMKMVVKKIVHWCHDPKAKCPVREKVCKWASEHKEMALGYLLAAVEPWKYAEGYCMHQELDLPPKLLPSEDDKPRRESPFARKFKRPLFSPPQKRLPPFEKRLNEYLV